jgi:hypothetical protein
MVPSSTGKLWSLCQVVMEDRLTELSQMNVVLSVIKYDKCSVN